MKAITLSDREAFGPLITTPSTTTMTLYEGEVDAARLQKRVQLVVSANPWLSGRLVSQAIPGRKQPAVAIQYTEPCSNSCCFEETSDPALVQEMDYHAICARATRLCVKNGQRCLDQDEPLFRVVLVHIAPRKFALLVSLSHAIADGHTYYCVLGMLDESATVAALQAERPIQYEKDRMAVVGLQFAQWFSSRAVYAGFVVRGLGQKLGLLSPPSSTVGLLNAQEVERLKAAHVPSKEVPFVSTNDVIAAWLCGRSDSEALFMTVNHRGKLPGLHEQLAGNYISMLAYRPAASTSPGVIRQRVLKFTNNDTPMPGALKSLRGRISNFTNWTSFAKHVQLPDCRIVMHLPVYQDLNSSPFCDFAVLFQLRPDETALLLHCTSPLLQPNALQTAGGERLFGGVVMTGGGGQTSATPKRFGWLAVAAIAAAATTAVMARRLWQ